MNGSSSPILYLDFDGVLHPESCYWDPRRGPYLRDAPGHTLFEHMAVLEQLLEPYPEIRIVLSTSWVPHYSFSGAARRLSPTLRSRLVGATYHSEMGRRIFTDMPRGLQIWGDVLRRRPSGWAALDDDDFGWPAWCRDQLIRTDGQAGLGATDIQDKLRTHFQTITSNKVIW